MGIERPTSPKSGNRRSKPTGIILVYAALLITALLGFAALGIDTGHLFTVQKELHNVADAAALAGASGLPQNLGGEAEAIQRAQEYAQRNTAGDQPVTLQPAEVTFYCYDFADRTFTPLGAPTCQEPNSVEVVADRTEGAAEDGAVDTYFGKVLGVNQVSIQKSAIGTIEPPNLVPIVDLRLELQEWLEACPSGEKKCGWESNGCGGQVYVCRCVDPTIEYEPACTTCVTPDQVKALALDSIDSFETIQIPYDQAGVAIFGFGNISIAAIPLTENLNEVRAVISALPANGSYGVHLIPFSPALDTAIQTVEAARRGDEAVVVIYNLDMGGPSDGSDVLAKAQEAENKGIRVYVIALGTGDNPTISPGEDIGNEDVLKQVAQMTGGKYYEDADGILTGVELETIMQDIAEHLPVRLTQ
jgi:hypothetical protein